MLAYNIKSVEKWGWEGGLRVGLVVWGGGVENGRGYKISEKHFWISYYFYENSKQNLKSYYAFDLDVRKI